MAKRKAGKAADRPQTARRNPAITGDERDAALAKGPEDKTAKERRESSLQVREAPNERGESAEDYAKRKLAENVADFHASDPIDAGDNLPIHHPTIPDKRDRGGLPPEASARPGKSSPTGVVPLEQAKPQAGKSGARVKVTATRTGYYDLIRRRPGDTFYIKSPEDFSRRWMVRAEADTPLSVSTPNQAIRQQHDEILAAKMGGGASAGLIPPDESNPLED
jgi:hypothetical protein